VTGAELILTHAMSGGKLTANLAKLSGAEFDVMNGTYHTRLTGINKRQKNPSLK
jgi:hypothetical protein